MILSCLCESTENGGRRGAEYQDAKHGAHNRVHNYVRKSPTFPTGAWRCTICTRVRTTDKGTNT